MLPLHRPLLALATACLATLPAVGQAEAKLVTSEAEVAGGRVAVHYRPVALPAIPLEEQQSKGKVWSMSDVEAAVLETDVALMAGKVLIPPGSHRLSTWFRKPGDWQLLIFDGPKNFKRGTPFQSLPIRVRNTPKARSELLKIEVAPSGESVQLQVFAGRSRLRVRFEPVPVVQHKGTLAGEPAVFEFYQFKANFRIQGRLRDLELIRFGRVRTEGKHGAVYDISCKSDGDGIFVICHSDTLRQNRELLAAKSKALQAHPGDPGLQSQVESLQAAVTRQSGLQSNVMVPGTVEKVGKRAATLGVEPVLDSEGTSFELSFGIRKAKFTLNEGQFKKLKWK